MAIRNSACEIYFIFLPDSLDLSHIPLSAGHLFPGGFPMKELCLNALSYLPLTDRLRFFRELQTLEVLCVSTEILSQTVPELH